MLRITVEIRIKLEACDSNADQNFELEVSLTVKLAN